MKTPSTSSRSKFKLAGEVSSLQRKQKEIKDMGVFFSELKENDPLIKYAYMQKKCKEILQEKGKSPTRKHWKKLSNLINNNEKDWGLLKGGVTRSHNSDFVSTLKKSINGIKEPSRTTTFPKVKEAILKVLDETISTEDLKKFKEDRVNLNLTKLKEITDKVSKANKALVTQAEHRVADLQNKAQSLRTSRR